MSSFGVGPQGFNKMRLSDCKADLIAGLTGAFGAGTNTSDATVFGQLAGVFAERYALLWEALEQVYNSSTTSAEGTSVDAILALNGILRLTASPTVTDPNPNVEANGLTLNGLVLYGTPGTLVPAGTTLQTSTLPTLTFQTDNAVTIGTAVNAVAQLLLSGTPTGGSYILGMTAPSGNVLSTPAIAYNALAQATTLTFAQSPTNAFQLSFGAPYGLTTASVPAGAAAAQVQTAVQNVAPFQGTTVTQSGLSYTFTWPTLANPTLGVQFGSAAATAYTVTQSTQALINTLLDAKTGLYPFTDVVFQQPSATTAVVSFGANAPVSGQPSSGAAQQATLGISNNTLVANTTAINIATTTTVAGRAAQAVATATCTADGPNAVPAGVLSVIGGGISGLTAVTNQLDCLPGRLVETDTEAMIRRESLLASRGSGALPSLLAGVLALDDVTAAIAFANLTGAAQQVVVFGQTPTKGSYQLAFQGTPTAQLAYNATAAQVQAALGAIAGLSNILVTGANVFGFVLDFNGSFGGQAVPLVSVASNTTDATVTPYFGRPPNSVELVVQGGSNAEVASVIYNALPGGIASYAQPVLRTTGSAVAGSTSVTLASVAGLLAGNTLVGQGLYPGTTVQSVTGNTATVTPAALGSYSGVAMTASNAAPVYDTAGNVHLISFSRPTIVPLYIVVTLITDTYLTPGNPNSGINPNAQFSPSSVAQIQADLIQAANATPIGGTVIARGTQGLAGSFRDIVGLLDYTLAFDIVNPPTNQNNLALPAEGIASAQSYFVTVSYI